MNNENSCLKLSLLSVMVLKYQVMSYNYVPWKHSLNIIVQILLFWPLHQKIYGSVQSA